MEPADEEWEQFNEAARECGTSSTQRCFPEYDETCQDELSTRGEELVAPGTRSMDRFCAGRTRVADFVHLHVTANSRPLCEPLLLLPKREETGWRQAAHLCGTGGEL